jgi:hypothetical protein
MKEKTRFLAKLKISLKTLLRKKKLPTTLVQQSSKNGTMILKSLLMNKKSWYVFESFVISSTM